MSLKTLKKVLTRLPKPTIPAMVCVMMLTMAIFCLGFWSLQPLQQCLSYARARNWRGNVTTPWDPENETTCGIGNETNVRNPSGLDVTCNDTHLCYHSKRDKREYCFHADLTFDGVPIDDLVTVHPCMNSLWFILNLIPLIWIGLNHFYLFLMLEPVAEALTVGNNEIQTCCAQDNVSVYSKMWSLSCMLHWCEYASPEKMLLDTQICIKNDSTHQKRNNLVCSLTRHRNNMWRLMLLSPLVLCLLWTSTVLCSFWYGITWVVLVVLFVIMRIMYSQNRAGFQADYLVSLQNPHWCWLPYVPTLFHVVYLFLPLLSLKWLYAAIAIAIFVMLPR